jgi:adenosine deaminase CECR1
MLSGGMHRPGLLLRARFLAWPAVLGVAMACGTALAQDDFSARFDEIKKKATDAELYRFLYELPKGGDLHNHMGGENLPETWYKVATNSKLVHDEFYARTKLLDCPDSTEPLLYDITINQATYDALSPGRKQEYEPIAGLSDAEKAKWLSNLWLDTPAKGREEFFQNIWPRISAMEKNPYLMAELLVENMKLFGAEHVRYVETQAFVFGIDGNAFTHPDNSPWSMDEVLNIFRDRLKQPDAVATGVTVRFQSCVLRFTPWAIQGVEDAYKFMDHNRDLFVGINMAGREDNEKGYPSQFQDVYRRMRSLYPDIQISIHAGESDEPNFHVRDTLYLGATRIGHGVNLYTDPQTMLMMRACNFLVEINLISNKLLGYVPDLDKHPFPDYLRFGIPVCLNTDDRGMFGSDLTDEYFTAVKHYNLSWDELTLMGRNSLIHSFVQPAVKSRLLAGYDSALNRFMSDWDISQWKAALDRLDPPITPYARREFHLP